MHHGLVLCTVVFFSSPLAYQLPRVTCQKEKLLYFFHHHFGWASSSDWSVYIAFSFGTDALRFFFFFLSVRWNSSWCKSRVNPKQHQYYSLKLLTNHTTWRIWPWNRHKLSCQVSWAPLPSQPTSSSCRWAHWWHVAEDSRALGDGWDIRELPSLREVGARALLLIPRFDSQRPRG